MYPESFKNLIEAFQYLGGVGKKTAVRMAYQVFEMPDIQANFLADSIKNVKNKIIRCEKCNNITEDKICEICRDETRNPEYLCVVEDPKTLASIEQQRIFNGYYHVLNGLIQTLDGINPEDIRLDKLIARIKNSHVKEIIIAVKPCLEGEMTALYIKNVLSGLDVVVSRIASGIPMGADMEYIDPITLEKAFDNRQELS